MSFKIRESSIDIDETSIENIFINTFMKSADEIQLKVYLAGLSLAKKGNINNPNFEILKMLDISEKEIVDAWRFWKSLRIVDFDEPKDEEDIFFDVSFLSLREQYIESNYVLSSEINKSNKKNKVIYDQSVLDFFSEVEFIMNQALSPDNRIKILDWLEKYSVKKGMVLRAVQKTYVDSPPEKPSLKYVEGIIRRWSSNNIRTERQAEEYEARFIENIEFYREVNSRLTAKKTPPTEAQIKVIEKWFSKINDKDLFFQIVDYCSMNYAYSTFNRLDKIFNKIQNEFSLNEEGIEAYINLNNSPQKAKQSSKIKKSNQNFKQDTYKTMSKEEAIKAMKRNNPALKQRKNN